MEGIYIQREYIYKEEIDIYTKGYTYKKDIYTKKHMQKDIHKGTCIKKHIQKDIHKKIYTKRYI